MHKKRPILITLFLLIFSAFIFAEGGTSSDTSKGSTVKGTVKETSKGIGSSISQQTSQDVSESTEYQSFNKWILNDRRGKRYADYSQFFNKLLNSAVKQDIPVDLLTIKIREGAAKNIPGQRLIAAISNELERLKTAKIILTDGKITLKNYNRYENTLKHISILLLGGLKSKTITNLFKIKDKYSRTINDVLTACDVLIQINSIDRLSQADLYNTGRALLISRLKSSYFSNIASIYLNARAKRIKSDDILKIIQRTLANGGGLIEIDQEISDRGTYR